jgi:hypothetical protein
MAILLNETNTYFNISPARIFYGEKASLNWNYTGSNSSNITVSIKNIGTFVSAGKTIVDPEFTRDYECEFRDDTDIFNPIVIRKKLTLYVDPRPEPLINFYSNLNEIDTGNSITLFWEVDGPDVSSIELEGFPNYTFLNRNGLITFDNITEAREYTLIVRTYTKEYRRTLNILVNYPARPRIIEFNASNLEPQLGEDVIIEWETYSEYEYTVYFSESSNIFRAASGTFTINDISNDTTFTLNVKDNEGYIESRTISILPKRPEIVSFTVDYPVTSLNIPIVFNWEIINVHDDIRLIINGNYQTVPFNAVQYTYTPTSLPLNVELQTWNSLGTVSDTLNVIQAVPVSLELTQVSPRVRSNTSSRITFNLSGNPSELRLNGNLIDKSLWKDGFLDVGNIPRGLNNYSIIISNREYSLTVPFSITGMDNPQIVSFTALGQPSTNSIATFNNPSILSWNITGDYLSAKIIDPEVIITNSIGSSLQLISKDKLLVLEVIGLNGKITQLIDFRPLQLPVINFFKSNISEAAPNDEIKLSWSVSGSYDTLTLNGIQIPNENLLSKTSTIYLSNSSNIELRASNLAGFSSEQIFLRIHQDPFINMVIEPTWVRELEVRIAWDIQPKDTETLVLLHRNVLSSERLTLDGEVAKILTLPKETFKISAKTLYKLVEKSYLVEVLDNNEIRVTESLV